MTRPTVYKDIQGIWWAALDHETWVDASPFGSWAAAIEHAEWLHAMAKLRAGSSRGGA